MSNQSSGIIKFDCGFDHSWGVGCDGDHEAEVIIHHTSDTVTIRVDEERLITSCPGFHAIEECIEKLSAMNRRTG